jgi:Zn-dependent protease/CBS domain-containing protein
MRFMRSWSISVGRLFGIELRVHLTFLFLLLFVWVSESAVNRQMSAGPGLALVGVIFGSVILHELGHALVSTREGIPAKSIILLPIGGITTVDESRVAAERSGKPTWARDIRIAIAGPTVNFLVALVAAFVVLQVLPGADLWRWPFIHSGNLPKSIVWANLYLAGFNLLPAYPMDGGRILRALFSRKMEPVQATRRAVFIGQAFAMVFMLAGFFIPNFWLVMVGVFVFMGAQIEERSIVFQSVLETVQMHDIMLTDFATLSPADTLEDALEKAVHSLQDDFPVVRGSDMVGVVSRQKILDALRSEGNGYVQSVMSRMFEVASRGESLASAFKKLTARNLSIIPVVEDQHLVGIVTLQNLMHSMALLAESRKLRREAINS